ncbi:protein FAR1-related sequence 5 [Tanacetum coccineum]|uniref:Protein FAR1-related sequence 5 n=1 Tax=Tanacetum coccineum TaxID=301880 RepID=A0ABQ5EAN6_9ASTR
MAFKSISKKRRGRRVSITISMSDDEEQQKNKRMKKLHDRPSKTAKSKGDSDAQMLIHKMENRKKYISDFLFDYLIENAELTAIFWADEVSKYNYREFGDVVSFDATFKTNKYKMVFVPFTAIDNHRKCVTVAAGLLKNETIKSYIWLLKAFIKAFGKAPSIVVTDQDGAMRNAIEAEFGGSKHRLCMWHITQKLPAKICAKIYDETDFKEKLNKIVWNMYIAPEEFEYRWGKLMEEFNLENHKWLTKMFNIRSTWIPAYFIDSPLCGLMRTTSRCCGTYEMNANVEMIPQQYILSRWTKILPITYCSLEQKKHYGGRMCVVENYGNEATSIVDHCNTTDNLEQLVGVLKPPVVDVNNPTVGVANGEKSCVSRVEIENSNVKKVEVGQEEVLVQKEVCQEEVVVQKEVCQEEVVQENVDLSEDEEELSEEDEELIHE